MLVAYAGVARNRMVVTVYDLPEVMLSVMGLVYSMPISVAVTNN